MSASHECGTTRSDCHHNSDTHNHSDHESDHGHNHSHGHSHQHFDHLDLNKIGFKLKVSTAITVLFVIIGIFAGIYSGSIALISDAAHNFTDALALIIALFSVWLQTRPASMTKTYGYHRAGILAAFINSSTLILIVAGLLYSAIERFLHPQPIATNIVTWTALTGLIVNICIGWALHRESKCDITIRSAYIHMMGDAAGSVGIIIGAIVIHFTGYFVIDPLISIVISLLILWTSWDILRETVNLLLEGTPRGIDVDSVSGAIKSVPGVRELHHLHIWGIAAKMTALSCHLKVDDMSLSRCHQILIDVNQLLRERFHIEHATLQLETHCAEEDVVACQRRE